MARRHGFTLVELLITITIIGLMAGMVLFAGYSASEEAKAMKTRALIAKLDAIIKAKWETYKTRRLLVTVTDEYVDLNRNNVPDIGTYVDLNQNGNLDPGEPGTAGTPGEIIDQDGNGSLDPNIDYTDLNGDNAPNYYGGQYRARLNLIALRDVMRMEMPDRWSDVTDLPYATGSPNYPIALGGPQKIARPSVSQNYLRKYNTVTSRPSPPSIGTINDFEGAECLYMIVMGSVQEDGEGKDLFRAGDTGDVDGDGFPEFLDGWGRPIKFLRWPVGFASELNTLCFGKGSGLPGADSHTYYFLVDPTYAGNVEQIAGKYLGATLVKSSTTGEIDTSVSATITGYNYDVAQGAWKFTMTTPPMPVVQRPFERNGPFTNGDFVVLANEPFDHNRVFPQYTTTSIAPGSPDYSVPTWATTPLIYSSGADKCYGVATFVEFAAGGNPNALHYTAADVGMNPYYAGPTTKRMIGLQIDNDLEEFFQPFGWRDNIHNHLQGTR